MKYIVFLGGFVLLLIFLIGSFYWYGYRPSQIKQECSWVKKHQDAISAIPAKTEKELMTEGIIKNCILETDPKLSGLSAVEKFAFLMSRKIVLCSDNQKIIDEYKNPRPEVPAKNWLEKATNSEYLFCLHSRGL